MISVSNRGVQIGRFLVSLAIAGLLIGTLGCHAPRTPSADGYLEGADGAQIHYRVVGSGPDTVVVLHGGPGAGINSVLPSVHPMADRHVLILFDQRGGGRSELPDDTTKLQPRYFVEDLEAVRKHFHLQRMNVVTHSFGSILLAQYAQRYPDRLRRIVFHGATGPRLQQELEAMRSRAAALRADSALSAKGSRLLQQLLSGTADDPIETCRAYEATNRDIAEARGQEVHYAGTTCDAPPEAVRYYYRYTAQRAPRYYGDWDFTDSLSHLTAPLLVVYGRADSFAIPAQRAWAAAAPNGRLLLVPDADKAAFAANPQFVFPAIDTFLDGRWPAAATRPDAVP